VCSMDHFPHVAKKETSRTCVDFCILATGSAGSGFLSASVWLLSAKCSYRGLTLIKLQRIGENSIEETDKRGGKSNCVALYTSHVIVKYALTSDEYVKAQGVYRTRVARGRVFFRNLYGLTCLIVALAVYSRFSGARWWGDLLFLAAGLLLLERTILWRLRASAKYRSTPSLGETVELKIEESNILRAVAAESTEIRWANILACRETKSLFLLRTGPDDVLVIPKRSFAPGDLYRFKDLRQKELIV